jgi:uncharacterized protein (TIGR02598 family)
MKTRPAVSGFSLVEVVLSIGIATFGLVAILGLLNAGVDTDGAANRDTTLVAMSDYVLNDLRAEPFDSLWAADPTTARSSAPTTNAPADTVYYFTNEGAALAASNAVTNPDLLYQCVVHKLGDSLTQNPKTHFYNQLKLQLVFTWPATVGGAAGKAGSKTLYASIARR